jgi:hypothetical protein
MAKKKAIYIGIYRWLLTMVNTALASRTTLFLCSFTCLYFIEPWEVLQGVFDKPA